MNIRVVATVVLSVAFFVLLITGVLLFTTEYDYFTSSLHIWASILVLVGFTWHLKNNWRAYKSHLKLSQGKRAFWLCTLGVLPISIAILIELPPVSSVLAFGEKLRSSAQLDRSELTVVDLSGQAESSNVHVFIKTGEYYHSEPQPLMLGLTYTTTPQVAIWLEDMQGNFLKTMYITGKSSNSSFQNQPGESDVIRRPEALPIWSHKRGVRAEDGLFMPDATDTEFDGLTAATPKNDHQLRFPSLAVGRYRLMMELNRSYDFNAYYHTKRFLDDPIYSGNGSSGQPSVIYQAEVDTRVNQQVMFELVGHGHHSGQNGTIYSTLENLTTAKQLIEFAVITTKGAAITDDKSNLEHIVQVSN